jgi:basic amino acid/polyamine antiporter, APA family
VSLREPQLSLRRRLGPVDAAAIVISNVIGVGIFTTPGFIALLAPHPAAMLGVWLAGGLLAFAGAMAYAELAALRPSAGGEYVYLREGFGPMAAFLTGWTSFVAGFSGAIAAGAIGMADYLGQFFPAAGNPEPIFAIPLGIVTLNFSPRAIVALTAIFGLALIHIRGVGPGRVVQNILAVIKVGVLLLFVAAGLTLGYGSVEHFAAGESVPPAAWLLAMIPVMFSYSGWNAAAYVAEEIRNPGRNVPLALALGTGTVVIIYLLINVLYLYALPLDELRELAAAGQIAIAAAAAERLFGPVAAGILSAAAVAILLEA